MIKRWPRSEKDVKLLDIPCDGITLNTRLFLLLLRIYNGNPPDLPCNDAPLWQLFQDIDEKRVCLPQSVVNTNWYLVLKPMCTDIPVLQANQIFNVSDWTREKRSAMTLLSRTNEAPSVSPSTISLLDSAKQALDKRVFKECLLSRWYSSARLFHSFRGKNCFHVTLAAPFVDIISDAITTNPRFLAAANRIHLALYMKGEVPSAYAGFMPSIVLGEAEGMHFICAEVKEYPHELFDAFGEALKAGFFLTQRTGYSAIIVGVAGTRIMMGLHTLLSAPPSGRESAQCHDDSCRFGAWMRSTSDPLPAMDKLLRTELDTLSDEKSETVAAMARAFPTVVYPCVFNAASVHHIEQFDKFVSEYLQFIVDPICFGLSMTPNQRGACICNANNNCHVARCTDHVDARYRLPGCPDAFVAKLSTVDDAAALVELHVSFDRPIYAHVSHTFARTTTTLPVSEAQASGASGDSSDYSTVDDEEEEAVEEEPVVAIPDQIGARHTLVSYVCKHASGEALSDTPTAAQLAKLMGLLIVLHDKMGIYHCDVRRANVIVGAEGDSVRLIDYEYAARCVDVSDSLKAVPEHLQPLLTVQFFSAQVLEEDPSVACSFTQRRYVQLLDICSVFYFVLRTLRGGSYCMDELRDPASRQFDDHFRRVIAREKDAEDGRTTSAILQDMLAFDASSTSPSMQGSATTILSEAKAICEKHNWFANFSFYRDLCDRKLS